jgi:drug/metabolite transporter (DMT)-like permease
MSAHLIGQTAALLTALTWACALVLFKRSGEHVPPIGLNLFKNTIALLLLGATLPVFMAFDSGHALAPLAGFDASQFLILALSGIIGIALADTLLFYGLNLIGVGLLSIIDCAYSPCILLCAWLLLGEVPAGVMPYVGGTLIIAGVFTASRHTPPPNRTRAQMLLGMSLVLLAIVTMAVGVVMAKPVIEEMAVLWATAIRLLAGTLALALYTLLGRGWRSHWAIFRPAPAWKFAVPAAVLGTYLSLIFWIAGFKYTYAAVAAVLNQTSVVFAMVLAVIFLHEPLGPRKLLSFTMAMTGVVIVTFSQRLDTLAGWRSLWPAWLLLALMPFILHLALGPLVRRREWRAAGRCAWCGCDLRNLPEPRCPECGRPPTPSPLPPITDHP